jgi:hypothetical protein
MKMREVRRGRPAAAAAAAVVRLVADVRTRQIRPEEQGLGECDVILRKHGKRSKSQARGFPKYVITMINYVAKIMLPPQNLHCEPSSFNTILYADVKPALAISETTIKGGSLFPYSASSTWGGRGGGGK